MRVCLFYRLFIICVLAPNGNASELNNQHYITLLFSEWDSGCHPGNFVRTLHVLWCISSAIYTKLSDKYWSVFQADFTYVLPNIFDLNI